MNLFPGDSNFGLIVGPETLASRWNHCASCPTLASVTPQTVFFLVLEVERFSEDEGNLVYGLSRTGVLRRLTIFKISLLCPSGIPARSFSVRYFALAVHVEPLLRNSPAYINKSSSTSLRKSSIFFLAFHTSEEFFADFSLISWPRWQWTVKRTEWATRTPTLPRELHIWAEKRQSLTPETQTFDVTWKHVLRACVHR